MLRHGIGTDYNGISYPRDPALFNLSGIIRDCFYNSGTWGWRVTDLGCDPDRYVDSIRRHYRPVHRGKRLEQAVPSYVGRHAADVTR